MEQTTEVRRNPELPGDWARDIAAFYRGYAERSEWEPRRVANFAEAAKYEAIAVSMDRMAEPA